MAVAVSPVSFELPHTRLAGLRFGESDKPLVLALHGWLDNAMSFAPLARHLEGWQILAVEWPGHGLSDHRPGSTPLYWADYLLDLHCLLRELQHQQMTVQAVLGHSLGGLVASAYAALYPQNVRQLILIEAMGPLFESVGQLRSRLINSLDTHATPSKTVPRYAELQTVIRARRQLTGLDERFCRLIIERNMQETEAGVGWRTDPRLRLDSPLRLTFEQVDALMTQVESPALLLMGRQGYQQLHRAKPLMDKWYRNASVRLLDGDHHLHMGNAAAVAQVINEFLV
ncbi:alpha/beta fold hydrolase [Shewanella sp. GXUN23E]|uniref:alpha/beta fold hydrolase n=1 Tax=Shewanella sp. GXUN23E TaxID=3422498 RepID=UPI003D7DE0DE